MAFASGLHGWGFNVEHFAKIYADKTGVDKEMMMKCLLSDSFFNAKEENTNLMQPEAATSPVSCALCQFIMISADACHHGLSEGRR